MVYTETPLAAGLPQDYLVGFLQIILSWGGQSLHYCKLWVPHHNHIILRLPTDQQQQSYLPEFALSSSIPLLKSSPKLDRQMTNLFIPTEMRDWCWSSPGIWDWCAGQWETGSDSQQLTLPQPGMAYSNQLCCHLIGHCITSIVWQRKLCDHISSEVVQMEACSFLSATAPSWLKKCWPQERLPTAHHSSRGKRPALRGCRDQQGKITNMCFEKGYGIKLNLLCVARTAAPVSRVTPRSKDCKRQGRASGAILQALQSPQSCCCRTQHREQRATALADLSWLQRDLSQAQD